ncbi:hypothetical protein C2G38_2098313 [Gigaspora rosea]|uniref:Uncharacterized protein n=1 Tax=Gigaspora rosea TaxID=44941 RepID=A0A397V0K5_9GLOM|nr:hypothetical protein C2G38_2098313 [Gigaspora rosea]
MLKKHQKLLKIFFSSTMIYLYFLIRMGKTRILPMPLCNDTWFVIIEICIIWILHIVL